jgi:hypothetical protein
VRDHEDFSRFGNLAEVNAEAEIRVDLPLIYQVSANSRQIERELATGGHDGGRFAHMMARRVAGPVIRS